MSFGLFLKKSEIKSKKIGLISLLFFVFSFGLNGFGFASAANIKIKKVIVHSQWDQNGNEYDEPFFMLYPDGTRDRQNGCIVPDGGARSGNPRSGRAAAGGEVVFTDNLMLFTNYINVQMWDADGSSYDCYREGSDDFVQQFTVGEDAVKGEEICRLIIANPRVDLESSHTVCYVVN